MSVFTDEYVRDVRDADEAYQSDDLPLDTADLGEDEGYGEDETEADEDAYVLGGRGSRRPYKGGAVGTKSIVIAIIVVVVLILAFFGWRYWRAHHGSKEGFPAFRDALGYQTPIPGDPDRNILRRSRPYPPGRFPVGGLADFYFQYDPAYSTGIQNDYCWHTPQACAGMMLEPYTGLP